MRNFNLLEKVNPLSCVKLLRKTNCLNEFNNFNLRTNRSNHCRTINSLNNSETVLSNFNGNEELLPKICRHMKVFENFITDEEEKSLLTEIEPYIKRTRYQYDHWDDAIHGYRETEKRNWNDSNKIIIDRVCSIAFPPNVNPLQHVHVLDLAQNGYIKPHIDSSRFCGNTIAGLSLLSPCIMRLVHEKEKSLIVDVLLKERSLYIMTDVARYEYTHEILDDAKSFFKNQHVPRDRRISVICRNEPVDSEDQ